MNLQQILDPANAASLGRHERQVLFAYHQPKLVAKAFEIGCDVTMGESWRSPEQAAINAMGGPPAWEACAIILERSGDQRFHVLAAYLHQKAADRQGVGILFSVHGDREAQDLNLFLTGTNTVAPLSKYQELGAYWKSLHPLFRYGGDFRDGDHYSIEDISGRK